jgi:hypothetical protein
MLTDVVGRSGCGLGYILWQRVWRHGLEIGEDSYVKGVCLYLQHGVWRSASCCKDHTQPLPLRLNCKAYKLRVACGISFCAFPFVIYKASTGGLRR